MWRVGAPADDLYVVLSGEVKDSVVDADGYEVIHFVHGPGMTFGEPRFFAVDRHRVVEIVAVAPSVLIRLERRHFVPFMAQYPTIKDRVLERLASITRWQTTMLASAFRRSLPDRVRLRLLAIVFWMAFRRRPRPVQARSRRLHRRQQQQWQPVCRPRAGAAGDTGRGAAPIAKLPERGDVGSKRARRHT